MVAIWVAHETLLGVISQPNPTPFTRALTLPLSPQAHCDLSAAEAVDACAATRDAWACEEAGEWEAAHHQYPAALAHLREAARPSLLCKPTVYILTTRRDTARVEQLLRRHSVSLPAERILCATQTEAAGDAASGSAAQSKATALAALRERHGEALVRYVDDDADCLRAVAADPRLFSVQLFFASWGYATEEQRSNVAAMPRVREPCLEPLCLHRPWPYLLLSTRYLLLTTYYLLLTTY